MTASSRPLVLGGATSFEDAVAAIVARDEVRAHVVEIERSPWIYASTSALDEVVVHLSDGGRLTMLLKNPGRWAPLLSAAPKQRDDHPAARLEMDMYLSVLGTDLDTPRCYATSTNAERTWLFLEKVGGVELYQVGDMTKWKAAAHWLARFHDRFAHRSSEARSRPSELFAYDGTMFRSWIERAAEVALERAETAVVVRKVERRLSELAESMAGAPQSLIHGQYFAANVLVEGHEQRVRVRTVDWETAGRGPGVLDLAALVCGWDEVGRRELISAYGDARGLVGTEQLTELVDIASVALAVQWLGWVHVGEPPPHQTRNWLQEAHVAMERLGW